MRLEPASFTDLHFDTPKSPPICRTINGHDIEIQCTTEFNGFWRGYIEVRCNGDDVALDGDDDAFLSECWLQNDFNNAAVSELLCDALTLHLHKKGVL